MSYDLAVFDPKPQLRDQGAFAAWYESRAMWADGMDYNEPSNAGPALQEWFREIIQTFPPLNGRLRPGDFGSNQLTSDYAIGVDMIYVAFPSGSAQLAYELTRRLAAKHNVGFFDISGDGCVWFPHANGSLELIHTSD